MNSRRAGISLAAGTVLSLVTLPAKLARYGGQPSPAGWVALALDVTFTVMVFTLVIWGGWSLAALIIRKARPHLPQLPPPPPPGYMLTSPTQVTAQAPASHTSDAGTPRTRPRLMTAALLGIGGLAGAALVGIAVATTSSEGARTDSPPSGYTALRQAWTAQPPARQAEICNSFRESPSSTWAAFDPGGSLITKDQFDRFMVDVCY